MVGYREVGPCGAPGTVAGANLDTCCKSLTTTKGPEVGFQKATPDKTLELKNAHAIAIQEAIH
jgi:hypothetical protein